MNPPMHHPMRITVLAGGPSAEREVSLDSGRAIAAALLERGHQVHLADIDPDDLSALDVPADVIFPALHGTFGEDGQLQQIMEQRGLCFVGSGSAASALAMDKVRSKELAARIGCETPAWRVADATNLAALLADVKPPVVVKPVDQGSSVTSFLVRADEDLDQAVQTVVAKHGRALIEQFIVGDEITVGLLAGDPLPPVCIRPKVEFYDYDAKYYADDTEYLFDFGRGKPWHETVRTQSAAVFREIGCRHLARVDWMLDAQERLWFLELNTLPGFTSHSLTPKAAASIGIEFGELVERIVRMAWEDA